MIAERFEKMGARAVVRDLRPHRRLAPGTRLRVDVHTDRKGEYFDLAVGRDVSVEVVDLRPELRHLLLLARMPDGGKEKFLCGHDERHWFVAAVPGASASNVATALEALKPALVRRNEHRRGGARKNRHAHRNPGWIRQGEWFFVPVSDADQRRLRDAKDALADEPIRRGSGKPHMCQQLVRIGGRRVYVHRNFPNGLTENALAGLLQRDRRYRRGQFRMMVRNPDVYVRGRITHPDHATVVLRTWHRVAGNTETEAPAMRHVAFLD